MLVCGQASAAERAGGCHTSASWLFETSDHAFPDTPTGATNSCEYTDANGKPSRFYYRLTFTHDPVQDGAPGQMHPYVKLNDDVLRGSVNSIVVAPYFYIDSKPKPDYCFVAYRNTVIAHEGQHKADALRWPAIGNAKTKPLFGKFDDSTGTVSAALGSGYSEAEALMQKIRVTENNIRTVLEARAVHAELSAHYKFINRWRKQERKRFELAPFLFEPELTFQGLDPYTYNEIKNVDEHTLAKMVVDSILYSEHSFHKSHSDNTRTNIGIEYTFDDAGYKFTYIQAHEAFFGTSDSSARFLTQEKGDALNTKSDKSYKQLNELQKLYCEQMAELIAMYAKWKHYENRSNPKNAYSIRLDDISWIDDSKPETMDTLDYAREIASLMMQVDWYADGEPKNPQEARCKALLLAKKVPGLSLDKSASAEEKQAYLYKLYAADAQILRNIAQMVRSRDPKEERINMIVQVICSARGLPGVFLPAKVDAIIKQEKAERAARSDNRESSSPETVAEYYDSIADLLQLFEENRTTEEYAILVHSTLFFVAGRASKQNVQTVKKSLNEARNKARNKRQRSSGSRIRL